MLQWQLRWPWQDEGTQFATTVDLGGGRMIRAEDIVDGHANRLRKSTEQGADKNMSATFSPKTLTPAIHKIAPHLAPLTDLAQQIADKSPTVQPTDKFRNNLQRALETSHRQQRVRRVLGIQPAARKAPPWWQSPWGMVLIAIVALVGIGVLRQQAKRDRN